MTKKESKKEKYLGEFEQVALLALIRLGDQAYGAKIRQLIHEQIDRDVAIGALYSTLERLEKKGMVTSKLGEPTAERGGRKIKSMKNKSAMYLKNTRAKQTTVLEQPINGFIDKLP